MLLACDRRGDVQRRVLLEELLRRHTVASLDCLGMSGRDVHLADIGRDMFAAKGYRLAAEELTVLIDRDGGRVKTEIENSQTQLFVFFRRQRLYQSHGSREHRLQLCRRTTKTVDHLG